MKTLHIVSVPTLDSSAKEWPSLCGNLYDYHDMDHAGNYIYINSVKMTNNVWSLCSVCEELRPVALLSESCSSK